MLPYQSVVIMLWLNTVCGKARTVEIFAEFLCVYLCVFAAFF